MKKTLSLCLLVVLATCLLPPAYALERLPLHPAVTLSFRIVM